MIHVNMSEEVDTINGVRLRYVVLWDLTQDYDDKFVHFFWKKYTLILDHDGSWQEVPF